MISPNSSQSKRPPSTAVRGSTPVSSASINVSPPRPLPTTVTHRWTSPVTHSSVSVSFYEIIHQTHLLLNQNPVAAPSSILSGVPVSSITPFSPIYSVPTPYGSMSSDEDPSDILANLSIVDLTVERVNQLRIEVGKLQSVHHCDDIEMRLEELLHVVRQRKVIYRSILYNRSMIVLSTSI